MNRPRLDSAPTNTSSRETTMFSGGDEAIIIGRLPTGHAAVRGIRLTTLPARSLSTMRRLSATILWFELRLRYVIEPLRPVAGTRVLHDPRPEQNLGSPAGKRLPPSAEGSLPYMPGSEAHRASPS